MRSVVKTSSPKKRVQISLYHQFFPELERETGHYVDVPESNVFNPEDLPPPNCEFQRISLVNSYRYRNKSPGRAYCIFEVGNSGSAFECPLGLPRIFPMKC